MKKTINKKIVAILLILFTLLSNVSPIFAASGSGTWVAGQWASYIHTTDNAGTQFGVLLRNMTNTATGEKKSMDLVKDVITSHVNGIMTKLTRSFDVTSVDNIFLIGGGAKELHFYIKDHLPNAELVENAQFTNAECFELMGKMKLSK